MAMSYDGESLTDEKAKYGSMKNGIRSQTM